MFLKDTTTARPHAVALSTVPITAPFASHMSSGSPLAVTAPRAPTGVTNPRDPPKWLCAEKLTASRANQLLNDLERPCPSPEADAEQHSTDAQRKKFALLVFAMGASGGTDRPTDTDASPPGKDKDTTGKETDEHTRPPNDAFAGAVANCLTHRDRDVRILAVETLVTIAERDDKTIVPHVPKLLGLLKDPDDSLLVLAAFRKESFPSACRAAADAAASKPDPTTIETGRVSVFDVIATSLATHSSDTTQMKRNLSTLQLLNELGPNVQWRHRDLIARFLQVEGGVSEGKENDTVEPTSDPTSSPRASLKRKRDEQLTAMQTQRPAFGFAACELALRALAKCPEAAKTFADEARAWCESNNVSTRSAARRLVTIVEQREDTIRRKMLAHGNTLLQDATGEAVEALDDALKNMTPFKLAFPPATKVSDKVQSPVPREPSAAEESRMRKLGGDKPQSPAAKFYALGDMSDLPEM